MTTTGWRTACCSLKYCTILSGIILTEDWNEFIIE
jgi:hypothetical protein